MKALKKYIELCFIILIIVGISLLIGCSQEKQEQVKAEWVEILNPEATVVFQDAAFEKAIKKLLGKGPNDAITRLECGNVTAIHVIGNQVVYPNSKGVLDYKAVYSNTKLGSDYIVSYEVSEDKERSERGQIQSLVDVQYFVNLQVLELLKQSIKDLTPLKENVTLRSVNFSDNQIQDIRPLSQIPNLTTLVCGGNQIEDISSLAPIIGQLTYLGLECNQIKEASILSQGHELIYLIMNNNNIESYPDFSQVQELENINFAGNPCDN